MIDVAKFVLNKLQESNPELELETKFLDSLVDSLDLFELSQAIEETYGVDIFSEILSCQTAIDVVNLTHAKLLEIENGRKR